ncbi:AMP-binding protein [Nocardioides sp. HDW12B]|uniref:AMP-binding protein n=1 Tax=Nocardioides sp. HDW12B TaxID=2714939 RepID=UPI0014082E67|nr:AMP-binding protein [Nocardioides sp. HDW12B]QIK65925.1 AMP-binding protein [Nocardioides sp. HDW12B]
MPPTNRVTAVLSDQVVKAKVLTGSGIIRPYSPRTLFRLAKTVKDWGVGPAGGFAALAVRSPDAVGLVDELGELTYKEIDDRGTALADALTGLGVKQGEGLAIMARNHRGFIDATVAGAKLGADILFLNTAFAGPQLVEVLEREDPKVVVYDEEFSELLSDVDNVKHVVAWTDGDVGERDTVEKLIEKGDKDADLPLPEKESRLIILTSGTTGTPKGAPRSNAGVDAAVSLLSRMPLRRGWTCHIAAPLFHTWGFAHMALAMLLESKVVLRRKFDPEECLKTVQEHQCDSLVVIPVMLQRILKLSDDKLESYDLPSLKVVAASGSALPGDLGVEWMDRFGDNLYNTYGSTEVAYATIADPKDLREAPGTAGRTPHATEVRIYDENDEPVKQGETGRIFVGNGILFEGYTGGGHKDMIDGLMSSGDVGYLDEDGRLFVEGRDDDMIVSGGENVFPNEVEDCLTRHEAVHEAACIGVDDEDYGKRLKAFVALVDGKDVSEDDLKAHVKSNLARYKVPREIVFMDELPRNATGKLLKRELEENGEDAKSQGDEDAGDAADAGDTDGSEESAAS